MKIDLSTLRENDLRKYSYETTKSVIDELENVCISNFVGIHAIEQIETYYAFARLIKNRVSNNEFTKVNGAHWSGVTTLRCTACGRRYEKPISMMVLDDETETV